MATKQPVRIEESLSGAFFVKDGREPLGGFHKKENAELFMESYTGHRFSVEEIKEAVTNLWIEDFGKLYDASSERDGYFICGFITNALKQYHEEKEKRNMGRKASKHKAKERTDQSYPCTH